MKSKNRLTKVVFCEWNSVSNGHYNTGGIICKICNFNRVLLRKETYNNYQINNKIERENNCPKCNSNDWYWLPPIARVPRKNASKSIWRKFWLDLINRKFNHPINGCR